jgi:hypothetical protein
MNTLPPGAIPKLYRMKRDGKEFGAFYVNIKKKPVNLRTQNYFKARERALQAVEGGRRDFPDDRYFEDNTPIIPTEVPAANNPTPSAATPIVAGDWTADATRAAAAGVEADQYFPPALPPMPQPASSGWEDAAPKAAPMPAAKPAGAEGSTSLPPEMLDGLIKQIAVTIVELQIQGQEYLWLRFGKLQPGVVPLDSKARELPVAIWESQVRKWIPTDVPLPEWLVAPILCAALTIPVQLEGATPIKKPDIAPK